MYQLLCRKFCRYAAPLLQSRILRRASANAPQSAAAGMMGVANLRRRASGIQRGSASWIASDNQHPRKMPGGNNPERYKNRFRNSMHCAVNPAWIARTEPFPTGIPSLQTGRKSPSVYFDVTGCLLDSGKAHEYDLSAVQKCFTKTIFYARFT
jgi:hypothetical protein